MIEIYGDTVRDLVASRIAEYSTVKIYKEKARQDYPTPCFFVWQPSLDVEPRIGGGLLLSHKISVQYKPASKDEPNNEMFDMGILLISILDKVPNTLPGQSKYPIYSLDRTSKIIQERLVFSATFNVECEISENDFVKIKDLESKTEIKK